MILQTEFGIRLGRSENIEKRQQIFVDRYNQIEEHNKNFRDGKTTYELALNEMAHLTDGELVEQKTGLLPKPDNFSDNSLPAESDTRRGARASPASFDWRTGENRRFLI